MVCVAFSCEGVTPSTSFHSLLSSFSSFTVSLTIAASTSAVLVPEYAGKILPYSSFIKPGKNHVCIPKYITIRSSSPQILSHLASSLNKAYVSTDLSNVSPLISGSDEERLLYLKKITD